MDTMDTDVSSSLLKEIRDCWLFARKGDRIGLSRWFGFIHASKPFDEVMHIKLLATTYLCLQLGLLTREAFASLTRMEMDAVKDEDQVRVPMAQGNEELGKLRKACANTLELIAAVLSDPHHPGSPASHHGLRRATGEVVQSPEPPLEVLP
jgi:hypothetical protein